MDRVIKKYLWDIKNAIDEIESFFEIRPRQYEVYLNDLMFRRAIERNVGIIGEAVGKIIQIEPTINITDAKNIKGVRNYVVHAYDSLQPYTIWAIVIKDLPILKQEVITLLSEK